MTSPRTVPPLPGAPPSRFSGLSVGERCSSIVRSTGLQFTGRPRAGLEVRDLAQVPGDHLGAELPKLLSAVVLRPYEGTHRDASISSSTVTLRSVARGARSPAQARSPERYPASSAPGPPLLSF